MWKLLLLLTVALTTAMKFVDQPPSNNTTVHGFEVDYENNQFLLDGKPFRYVSGSFHYFRTPKVYWRDRLRKMRAAGLNAVSTYVEWSLHQPRPDVWKWDGEADIVEFLKIAQEEDLLVLLRPGPYICAERDLGGLPPWLMTQVPDIKMRTNDPRYMEYVKTYFQQLLVRVEPLLRGNGGPIIMVQIENEYGSFPACDIKYREGLRDIIIRYVGSKALLYTTDGSGTNYLRCGVVSGAYATVDFGAAANITNAFGAMRQYQPNGPLVNSEYYTGWLTHWDEPFQRVSTAAFIKTLKEMLNLNASMNLYMMYGGTNFGFTAGANGGAQYSPQITSYDYDAPLTEAGDPTDKYFALRDALSQYLPMPDLPLPVVAPKGHYGVVGLQPVTSLFDRQARTLAARVALFEKAPTFEELDLPTGVVLYEAELPAGLKDPAIFRADVADRALVYLDDYLVGTLSRTLKIKSLPLPNPYAKRIQVLVESQGHLNFGNLVEDFKGMFNAEIDNKPLKKFNVSAFPLDVVQTVRNFSATTFTSGSQVRGPFILRGLFDVTGQPLDTYLSTAGWGKGVAYINGHNLGRYWPKAGPQVTLYVPGAWLKTGVNELIVIEYEYVPPAVRMVFQGAPNLGRSRMRV
ncbi:beta-galactosidase [Fopius arisanus]|uniref:Beta-galactosidase n=1 Tax=Fopius arisanus TaxID=64838 RepID=A0A0C9R9S9_9HYME|nr:PREDICTED: beta-galactosidase [Fopius arisanus]